MISNGPFPIHPEPRRRPHPPAGRPHAPPHARRIRRPGTFNRSRQTSPHTNRARRFRFAHLLGPSRHRKNHPRENNREHDQSRVHRIFCRPRRNQRNQAGHGRRRTRPPIRHAHHRLHRRDSPLQQSSTGRLPASRGKRQHPPHRRHHRESFLRNQRRPALPHSRLCIAAAYRRPNCAAPKTRSHR